MSDTNETAEIIKELQAKPPVPIKGNTNDFLAKFTKKQTDAGLPSGSNVGDPMLGMSKVQEEESGEEIIVNDNVEEPKKDLNVKKGGFVQKQIEENRRLKEELEKFKKDEIPKYEGKIAELEKLVQNSQTTAEANHYQEQLNKANEAKVELEQNLSKEIQELRSKLDFHDLTTNPDFQKQFVEPIQKSYYEAKEVVSDEPELLDIFNRAIQANAAIYAAPNEEERVLAVKARKELFKEIGRGLDDYDRTRFNSAIREYEDATKNHAQALINHHQTKQEIENQAKRKAQEARTQFINTWRDSYKRAMEEVDKEIAISDDIQSYMKEKGIIFDTSRDEAIALAATQQSNEEASVDEMNRLINQGRAYKKLQAQVKALQEMVKEKDTYINKLKGASRVDSTPKASESQQRRMSLPEGLAAKLAKFSPNGRNLATA